MLNVYSRQNEITCKLNRRQLRQDSELCQNDARSIDVENFQAIKKKIPGFNFLIRNGQMANLHGAVLATVWSCIIIPVILQFIIFKLSNLLASHLSISTCSDDNCDVESEATRYNHCLKHGSTENSSAKTCEALFEILFSSQSH